MADPSELQQTIGQASALENTVYADTGHLYSLSNAQYSTRGIQRQVTEQVIQRLPNRLRLVKTATNPSLAYGVNAGFFRSGSDIVTYAGGTGTLANDETNYVFLTKAGVLTDNVTGFPDDVVPIAVVLTGSESAGAQSGEYDEIDITDHRSKAMFSTAGSAGIQSLASQSLEFGNFTDNTDATGFSDFTSGTIPANAIILGWKAVVSTGFSGDTTAVIQVGINGDEDAYSADVAQSVLAAATVGSAPLAATAYVGATATPRVTVTGGADFTSISAGTMVVTVYYTELK